MRATLLLSLALVISCLAGAGTALAQTATIASPADGSQNVAVTPTITVHASHDIDSSKITVLRDAQGDTLAGGVVGPATIMLLRKDAYLGPDSLWRVNEIGGTYDLPDDTTLTFTPFGLEYATEYVAVLHGLYMKDSLGGAIYFGDTVVSTFKTLPPVHLVAAASILPGDLVSCGDTFAITFNRQLDSANTVLGPLASIERVVSTRTGTGADSTTWISDSTVSITTTAILTGDSTVMRIYPSSPLAGLEDYRLVIRPSKLNGDSTTDRTIPFSVYHARRVTIDASSSDTTFSPASIGHIHPRIGVSYFYPGDTLSAIAPTAVYGWRFSHWTSNESSLDGDTNSITPNLPISCSRMAPLTLTAMYVPVECKELQTRVDSGGSVLVAWWDGAGGYDSVGTIGNYQMCDTDRVFVIARPDSGWAFDGWVSNDGSLNAVTRKFVVVERGKLTAEGNVVLRPRYVRAQWAACTTGMAYGIVTVDDPQPGLTTTDIVTLAPDFNGTPVDETRTGPAPLPFFFSATVKAQYTSCYEIYAVEGYKVVGGSTGAPRIVMLSTPLCPAPCTSLAVMDIADCEAWVSFRVRRQVHNLRVELALYPESPLTGLDDADDALVAVRVTSSEPGAIISSAPGFDPMTLVHYIDYRIKACASVTVAAQGRSDQQLAFQQYSCATGYQCDSPPTDPIMTRNMNMSMKVRALFKGEFRLLRIRVRHAPSTTKEEHVPDFGFLAYVGIDGPKIDNWKQEATIEFDFSDAVDATTANPQTGILVIETDDRIDRLGRQVYWPAGVGTSNAIWSNGNKTLSLTLTNAGVGITKLQPFVIVIPTTIKNTLGESLNRKYLAAGETEYPPGMTATLHEFNVENDGTIINIPLDHGYAVGAGYYSVLVSTPPAATVLETPTGGNKLLDYWEGYTLGLGGYPDGDGSVWRDVTMIDRTALLRNDEAMIGAIFVDDDGSAHSVNRINTIKSSMTLKISNRLFQNNLGNMMADVIKPFLSCGGLLCDDDENLGKVSSPMFTRQDWFGARYSSPYLNDYYKMTGSDWGRVRFHFRIVLKSDP